MENRSLMRARRKSLRFSKCFPKTNSCRTSGSAVFPRAEASDRAWLLHKQNWNSRRTRIQRKSCADGVRRMRRSHAADYIRHRGYRVVECIARRLFLRRLGFDFIDYDGLGAASLVDLAGHDDFVRRERKKFGILSTGWGGACDGPVDGAGFGENNEL